MPLDADQWTKEELDAALTLGETVHWIPWKRNALDDRLGKQSEKYAEAVKGAVEFALVMRDEEISMYVICARRRNWLFRVYLIWYAAFDPQRLESPTPPYRHLADAEAACQQHHTTGNWK